MEELKLEEIVGYLPDGLEIIDELMEIRKLDTYMTTFDTKNIGLRFLFIVNDDSFFKPLLLPMTKEVLEEVFKNHNLDCFFSNEPINYDAILNADYRDLPHEMIILFCERHVDYQDLIGQGKAINKLTLKE